MSVKIIPTIFRKQPKWLRITTYMVAAYLAYALLLGVITPLVLKSQLPQLLSEKLGRVVSIEKIRINPFLLRFRVSNFVIKEDSSQNVFAKISLLEVDAGFWQTVTGLTPTLEHISIVQPYAQVARISGGDITRFNFSDIIDSLNSSSTEAEPIADEEETEIPHIRLGRFYLSEGHVLISDHVTDTHLDYPNLDFELTDLDTSAVIASVASQKDAKAKNNYYKFHMDTAEGGIITFNGQIQLAPLEVKGSLGLNNVALAPLWSLSDDVIEAKLTSGLLDFYADYSLSEGENSLRFRATDTKLSLSELTISDSNQPRIKIAGAHVNDLSLDTDAEQINIAEIIIDKPWIDGRFGKDGLDLQTILTPKVEASTAQASAASTAANNPTATEKADSSWRVILQSFALNGGDVQINESAFSDGMYWRISDIDAATGVVDTNFESPFSYNLSLGLAGDDSENPQSTLGTFRSEGLVNVNNQQVSGSFDVNEFALKQLQSYVMPYVNVTLQDGLAAASGSFEAGATSPITFNGEASITNLAVIDGLQQQPLLKWQDLLLQGIAYQSANKQFSMQKVVINKPYAKLVIDKDKQTNINHIMVQQSATTKDSVEGDESTSSSISEVAETSENPQAASSEIAILIEEVSINDGSTYFEDNSLRPRFAASIEELQGTIAKLSSKADTAAKVDINGKIDGYAPVVLKGEVNPLIEDIYLDLDFSINGAELTSVNPYSGTYMGHFIDKGLLSLDVNYRLEDNQLAGDNHVVIDQLTLGRKVDSEQAVSLPLGLAIALLQDSDGVIDLGMEVSGDLNSPSFGFGSIILKTLGNIITKAVTAPFSLLANLVGSSDELNEVAFSSGSAELNDNASRTLVTLSEALVKRPGLRVNIEGTVDEVTDAFELAEQKLQSKLLELSGEVSLPADFSASTIPLSGPIPEALASLFTITTNKAVEQERDVVKAILQQDDGEKVIADEQLNQALLIAMYNQVRSSINIPKHALARLAEDRAKLVKTFLSNQGNIDPNRLFLLNSRQHLKVDKSGVALTLEAN